MTTDRTSLRRRRTVTSVATTLAASAAGAAAVSWAAATPVATATSSPAPQTASPPSAEEHVLTQRLRIAQASLERVRRDVKALLAQANGLPKVPVTAGGGGSPAYTSNASNASNASTPVYVPPAAPAVAAPVAAPPAHTTTGASGAKP